MCSFAILQYQILVRVCSYSVDEKWHVPHFENMPGDVYDQAQLAAVFTDYFLLIKDKDFATFDRR